MPLLGCPCAVAERALGLPVQMKGKGSGGFAMELGRRSINMFV